METKIKTKTKMNYKMKTKRKMGIKIINIGNQLLNLLAKAFRNFFHYQC